MVIKLSGALQAAKYLAATGHVNGYTLTKHMAEMVVRDLHRTGLPCTVVRPSVIGSVAYDPLPGYFGGAKSAPIALFLGCATGRRLGEVPFANLNK